MASTTSSNYGTVGPGQNGNYQATDEDRSPLLQRSNSSRRTPLRRLQSHLTRNVDPKHGDVILLACYTITGLLDSSSISIWQSFVSMQTGNTVYLGLGLADPHGGNRWIKSGTSLACFCIGSFVFSRFHRFFSPRKRWVMMTTHLLGALFIAIAALIVSNDPPSEQDIRWQTLLPIALLSFQAAGQAVTSRALKFNALTSVVLTSIYCDLFSDISLFAPIEQNVERNQRALAPLCLIVGVVGGALWHKSIYGMPAALWTALVLKGLIALAWFFWKPAKEDDE